MTTAVTDNRVQCALCDFRSHSLIDHLRESHNMDLDEYLAAHPGAPTVSQELLDAMEKQGSARRKTIAAPGELTVDLMGQTVSVDAHVPEGLCLPMPSGYQFPTKGPAKAAFQRIILGLLRGRNLYVWSGPGTGKDAVAHAYSALTRRPCVMVTFRPGTDLSPWFYARSIDESGTGWEYGHLWDALVNGIQGRDGKVRAPLVVLSDVDRADPAQAEWFRILTDSISGRILGPDGTMVPLVTDSFGNRPQFYCTANSCGTGDARGRMTSANPIDASIMDRLGRKVQAMYMHWDDEGAILMSKFPEVAEKAPTIFPQLGNATEALRKSIDNEDIFVEFTHRGLCEILAECEDILSVARKVPNNLLAQGFRAWLDGMDLDTRDAAKRIIDPHVKGGTLNPDE